MLDKVIWKLPGAKQAFAVACIFACLEAFCIIACAISLGSALFNLWQGASISLQYSLLAIFGGSFLALSLLRSASDRYFYSFANRTCATLRRSLLQKTFSEGFRLIATIGSAALTTLALDDLDAIHSYARNLLPRLANAVVITLLTIITLWVIDWVSGLIALLMIPVTGLFMGLLGNMSQKAATSQRGVYEQLSNAFADALRGLDTLKRLGISKAWEQRITTTSEQFRKATMKVLRVATLSGSVLDLISTLALAAVAVMLGFRLVDGTTNLHSALIVLILVPDCFKSIRAFASDFHSSLDGKNALIAVLSLVGDSPLMAQPLSVSGSGSLERDSASLTLSLKNVSFEYENGSKPIISHVSADFTFPATVGVIGPSGAGKSTLLALLAGFLTPSSGNLALYYNGYELTQDQWKSEVLYLPQTPFIFHGTLRDNIAFYTPAASDKDILDAMRKVELLQLLESFPQGLDTIIGEAGRQLSGGEAHRVALCRALLDSSRKILIFDEPTAHLDIETEIALKEPMRELMKDRLVFFGTHRLHWLDSFDTVIRISGGSLVQETTALQEKEA